MLKVTPKGIGRFTSAITDTLRNIHLFTDSGELTEHGYAPLPLVPSRWDNGVYPDQAWEFVAGDPVDVVGYYVTDNSEGMVLSELFTTKNDEGELVETPLTIKNTGDRIAVSLRLNLLGAV